MGVGWVVGGWGEKVRIRLRLNWKLSLSWAKEKQYILFVRVLLDEEG